MASTLKINTLTGVTTAGSIAVTGEGNSTTTNLQQGLAKAWVKTAEDLTGTNDSFNVSSIDDDGTGDGGVTLTASMSNANYAMKASTISASTASIMTIDYDGTQSTASFEFEIAFANASTNRTAIDRHSFQSVHGDLA